MARTTRARRLAQTLALSAMLLPNAALANGPSSRTDVKLHEAEAVRAFSKGDFGRAADAFGETYAGDGATRTLWNLALAEFKAERFVASLTHLREYVAKADAVPKNVERARGLLDEIEAKVGRLMLSAPNDAEVTVDGVLVGIAPLDRAVSVDPGIAHVVVVHLGEREAREQIAPTGPNEVRVELAFPERVPGPVSVAPIVLSSTPVAPSRQTGALRVWITVGLGVGAAALAAGGLYTRIQAGNASDRADSIRAGIPSTSSCNVPSAPGCADLRSAVDSTSTNHTASLILWTGAGVFAISAIVAWLVLPHERAIPKGALVPLVGPRILGANYVVPF